MMIWKARKQHLALLTTFLIPGLVACQPANVEAAIVPTPTETESVEQAAITPTNDIAPSVINEAVPTEDLCPEPGEDTKLYLSEDDGYCFLYPADFEHDADWPGYGPGDVTLVGPQHDQSQNIYFFVQVMYNGQAIELETAQAYADKWQAIHNPSGTILPTTDETIGGRPAVVAQDMRGGVISDPYLNKIAFVIADGQKYRIALHNADSWAQAFQEQAESAWETITGSIVFFPPGMVQETVTASQVCPQPGDDTQLLVNEAQGFCFLYPSDFEPDQQTTGGLTNDRVVDTLDGMEIHPLLIVGRSGVGDVTRDSSIQETTIGGQPAVTFLDTNTIPGPVFTGQVTKNGLVYSIWASPYDPERYPEAVDDLDRIWQTVTDSIRFFSPVW